MFRPRRLALLGAAVALTTACSSGGSPAPAGPQSALSFSVSGVDVQSVAEPAPPLPDDVRTEVMATLDGYLNRAMVGPLRSGGPADDLAPLFTADAGARATGPDRATMVDEGLPRADGVQALASTARLGALAPSAEEIAVVTATIELRLQTTGGDPVTIVRTGDLVLVPEDDAWKIEGYDVTATRDSGTGPTTTAASG